MDTKELHGNLLNIIKDTENKVERYFKIGKLLRNESSGITKLVSELLPSGYGDSELNSAKQFFKKFRNNTEYLYFCYKLSWSHIKELIKDKFEIEERIFYLKTATTEIWTAKELEFNIKNELYETFLITIEKLKYTFVIEKLTIRNYKALKNVEIENPSRFLVFAGANATGKSSIFEALEFLMHAAMTTGEFVFDIFGGKGDVLNYEMQETGDAEMLIKLDLSFTDDKTKLKQTTSFGLKYNQKTGELLRETSGSKDLDREIVYSFSRIFIDNAKRAENKIKSPTKLWIDASNLNKILKPILSNDKKRENILEWLEILIPEFNKIEIKKDITGQEELLIYEDKYPDKPFRGKLISEGTMNIIALIASIYQFDEPQFLCIEEPETGLNPATLSAIIPFFKEMTEKKKHHIWITTHSVSIVTELKEPELSIVSKKDGETKVNQCKHGDFEKMTADKAWMSNMLKGGGLPW